MAASLGVSPREVAQVWKRFTPLIRPSERGLRIYAQHLEQARNKGAGAVLVLGATPELRSLALHRGFKVVYADRDPLMIQAMNLLMDYSGVDGTLETSLECDWLRIPHKLSTFKVVLGDSSLNHLSMGQMETLLAKLGGLITDSGSLCLRVITYPRSRKQSTVEEIFTAYRERAESEKTEMFRDLYMQLLFAKDVYRKSVRTSSHARLAGQLKKSYHSGEIAKDEFNAFAPVEHAEYTPTVPFRGEFRRLLSPEFRIDSVHNLEYTEHLDLSQIYELEPR